MHPCTHTSGREDTACCCPLAGPWPMPGPGRPHGDRTRGVHSFSLSLESHTQVSALAKPVLSAENTAEDGVPALGELVTDASTEWLSGIQDDCRRRGDTAQGGLSFLPHVLSIVESKLNQRARVRIGEAIASPAHCRGDQRRGSLVGKVLWAWGGGGAAYSCVNHLEEAGSVAAGRQGHPLLPGWSSKMEMCRCELSALGVPDTSRPLRSHVGFSLGDSWPPPHCPASALGSPPTGGLPSLPDTLVHSPV